VDIKCKRITSGILALLAATVVACGSASAGSAGHRVGAPGGGENYLAANDSYGQSLMGASKVSGGPSVAPSEAVDGPQFQQ
jgi:hypothetical protein